tara:strand:+ start:685 stop:999 length:315 start_codon:yes stop_codon:yes gene_type:complete
MAINNYTTSRRFTETTTRDRALAIIPETDSFKVYGADKKSSANISAEKADQMMRSKKYRAGKSGAIYDVNSGELMGKGFQKYYTLPNHVPFSDMVPRVKSKKKK